MNGIHSEKISCNLQIRIISSANYKNLSIFGKTKKDENLRFSHSQTTHSLRHRHLFGIFFPILPLKSTFLSGWHHPLSCYFYHFQCKNGILSAKSSSEFPSNCSLSYRIHTRFSSISLSIRQRTPAI